MERFFFRKPPKILQSVFVVCLSGVSNFAVFADSVSPLDSPAAQRLRLTPVAEDPSELPPAGHSRQLPNVMCDRCRNDGVHSNAKLTEHYTPLFESTGNGGVPLHDYADNSRSRRSFSSSGDSATHSYNSYGTYFSSDREAVELRTGIPGMRVSEWPSARTGLTLSQEQHQKNSNLFSHSSSCPACGNPVLQPMITAPVSQTNYVLPVRKPILNIPEYVW